MKLTDIQQTAIEALADANGDLDADTVWQSARSPTSPLHDLFDWDVDSAAVAHWRHIARQVIASCRIEVVRRRITFEVPRWVRDPDKPRYVQGYSHVDRVAEERDRALAVLETELARAETALRRAMNLAHYFDFNLSAQFNAMLQALAVIRTQMSGSPPPPSPGGRPRPPASPPLPAA